MAYLKNNILSLVLLIPAFVLGQTYKYTYTDPCTLNKQSINVPADGTVALNYFGNVRAFDQEDFSNGIFDNWLTSVSQLNSSSPCQSVTEAIISLTNSTIVANTLIVTTNIMSVMGGGMLPPAESINNSTSGNNSDNEENNNSNETGSTGNTQANQSNQETQANQSSTGSNGGSNTRSSENPGGSGQSTQGGESTSESTVSEAEGFSSQSTANSISNSIDGGGKSGKKRSNKAQKQAGSLIASGDIVVISNTDQTQAGQMRFVSSITHANTTNTRIKGALLTYTTVSNDLSVTLYKSWINPKKTFNLVLANTTATNFNTDLVNTTTALESFKFGKGKFTGMFGVNFTYGKLGERTLQNLSSIAGVHRNFRVSPRISTSLLVLGVYSPFTQFYEGRWWDAGVLVVPFSSWDIKITKTFKYNISFTGVYQTSGSFLNYQILTGGKLNF